MQQVAHKWNAQLYNEKHAFVYDYGKSLISLLAPKTNERILDLGCGSGELTSEIGDLAPAVLGIDKSEEMIAQARFNFPSLEFYVGDATNFSFEEKFDAIFSNATLHWVVAFEKAIENMYANLKKGGRLVLEFGGKDNVKTITDTLRYSLVQKRYHKQSETKVWYFPSIGEYTSVLETNGFKVTFAQWFDRPTILVDENSGIKDWLRMFGGPFFEGVEPNDVDTIIEEVQNNVKAKLFQRGKWFADYKRIRVVAYKQ